MCCQQIGRNDKHWRCEERCQYDICHPCFKKHQISVAQRASKPTKLKAEAALQGSVAPEYRKNPTSGDVPLSKPYPVLLASSSPKATRKPLGLDNVQIGCQVGLDESQGGLDEGHVGLGQGPPGRMLPGDQSAEAGKQLLATEVGALKEVRHGKGEETPGLGLEGEDEDRITVPKLGPVGSGWYVENDMTEKLSTLRKETIQLLQKMSPESVIPFNTDFLTPATLIHYTHPRYDPESLAKACVHRASVHRKLTCKDPFNLNGSCRIVGWDGQGRTIVALEPCTMRAPLLDMLAHFEYVFWTAQDLNRPGAVGSVVVVDVGGGYNWRHFLSVSAVMETVKLLKTCFHGRLGALYMIDMPSTFHSVYSIAVGYAEKQTKERIQCLSGVDPLLQELKRLEVDVETIDYFRTFMAQRRQNSAHQTWTPVIDLPSMGKQFSHLNLSQNTHCFTESQHLQFRTSIQQLRLRKWGKLEKSELAAAKPQ